MRKYPARNEGPRYSHNEIADKAQARALDDLARKPAGGDADGQYDEKALARHVHVASSPSDSLEGVPRHGVTIVLGERGYCAKLLIFQWFERSAVYCWAAPGPKLLAR